MTEQRRAYRALLVGNSEFPGDPDQLRTLLGPPADVRLLAEALTDRETGLHRTDAVRTVLEGTTQRVRDELEDFFGGGLPHEQLFLYYSGHGLLDLRNRLRLCARDTTADRLQARSIELEYVNNLIEGCAARSIVVILDCCFSGAAAVKGWDPAARLAGQGRFVMTSSSHGDTSADAVAAGEASPFTRHLITGLRSGAPGRDGLVTAYDVYRYVHGRLRTTGQVPHMKTEAAVGGIPLARRPGEPAGDVADERAGVGRDDAPLDVRPVFTRPAGRRTRLATYTDFSGVLHVRLPGHDSLLTTHRDAIVSASEGTPVTAQLYRHGDVGWNDVHSRAWGFEQEELRAHASGGAVSFPLPGGAGTVEWQATQVRAFRLADAQGWWPGTPRAQSPTREEYRADGGFRRLRWAAWRVVLWLLPFVVVPPLCAVLAGPTWYERGGSVVLVLPAVVSLAQALRSFRDAWTFRRIRGVLRDSGLYAIPMVMETGMVGELSLGGGGMGLGATLVHEPWAWLRYEGTPAAPTARDELGALREEEGEWPALSVPLQGFHAADIAQRAHASDASDASDASHAEHVSVVGVPRPGRWVVIHTANGMLWPRARAR